MPPGPLRAAWTADRRDTSSAARTSAGSVAGATGRTGRSMVMAPSLAGSGRRPRLGRERAAQRFEDDRGAGLGAPGRPQRVRAGQRRVAAQGHLDGRREPAQVEAAVAAAEQEGRLGQVHLGRDGLQPGGVARAFEEHDRGRVAAERILGEGVDLEEGQADGGGDGHARQ